jgi:hypothetical protein
VKKKLTLYCYRLTEFLGEWQTFKILSVALTNVALTIVALTTEVLIVKSSKVFGKLPWLANTG